MRSPTTWLSRTTFLAALLCCTWAEISHAREPGGPRLSVAGLADIRFEEVAYDEPGDGATWVRGASYKASFSTRGAQYMPAFGPRQPHNIVLSFSPASVRVAGSDLTFDRAAEEQRAGDRIEFQRGAFVERWDLAPEAVEQSFVFEELPTRGAIVLTIPVGSDLHGRETESGLVFENDLGRVEYSRAVAIDAEGRRMSAATSLVQGAIVINVDPAFVATARLPILVDPVVTTVHFDTTTTDTRFPESVWSQTDGSWLVVYNVGFTSADSDVYARQMSPAGVFSTGAWVDMTTASWGPPRCAALRAHDRMLVVAQNWNGIGTSIWCRPVILSGTTVTFAPQVEIASMAGGNKTLPDVGGDPAITGIRHACVAWTRTLSSTDSDIGYACVDANGNVQAGPTYFLHQSGTRDSMVSVSKSNDASNWLIAWQRAPIADIVGARVQQDGTILNDTFPVASTSAIDSHPIVSGPLTGTQRNLVVFRKDAGGGPAEVGLAALDGTTVLDTTDLTTLNVGTSGAARFGASVGSDGSHFLVAYSEQVTGVPDYDVYATDMFLSGSQLQVAQAHVLTYGTSLPVSGCQVDSTGGLGSAPHRYLIPFHIQQSATDFDVSASFFDGATGGSNHLECLGDGSGLACPCGNSGHVTHGCAHSASAGGALLLHAAGDDSISSNDVALQVSNIPPGAPALFFQGTLANPGSAFGDGLLCVGGTITRLAVVFASGTTASCPPGLPALGVPAAGGLRTYQAWYRDASPSFCTSSTFNLSNGLAIYWAP